MIDWGAALCWVWIVLFAAIISTILTVGEALFKRWRK
jgi:hypothetical protein